MYVEDAMAIANEGCRDFFSREVTYTPVGDDPIDTLPDGSPLLGEWVPSPSGIGAQSPLGESDDPVLEILASDLALAGITPDIEGDVVTFDVLGESRTYRVIKAVPNDVGTWRLSLGQRS